MPSRVSSQVQGRMTAKIRLLLFRLSTLQDGDFNCEESKFFGIFSVVVAVRHYENSLFYGQAHLKPLVPRVRFKSRFVVRSSFLAPQRDSHDQDLLTPMMTGLPEAPPHSSCFLIYETTKRNASSSRARRVHPPNPTGVPT